jgi:hypothetical protein
MSQSTWLTIDNTEIINNARVAAYLRAAGKAVPCTPFGRCGDIISSGYLCAPCPGFTDWQGVNPYHTAVIDQAPWVDLSIPQSTRVYGYSGIDILGISDAPSVDDNGRVVRDIEVQVLAYAADEAAMSYARSWLAQAIKGSPCGPGGCASSTMCFLAYCPTPTSTDPLRQLLDIEVIDGPTFTRWVNSTSDPLVAQINFTIRSHGASVWASPLPGGTLTLQPASGTPTRIDLPDVYEDCLEPTPCAQDPECPRPTFPDLPAPPVDACYPSQVYSGRRVVGQINGLAVPDSLVMAPNVTVDAGSGEIRNFTVRFWVNSLELSCDLLARTQPCAACSDITVAYIPPGGKLKIDGRVRRSVIECLSFSGVATAAPTLYGPMGSAYTWPEFSCGFALCVEVLVADPVPEDATVTIEFPYRADVI